MSEEKSELRDKAVKQETLSSPSRTVERRAGERSCPRCGAVFVCGNEAGAASCWCAELPAVLPVPGEGGGCYCPDCLRAIIAQQNETGNQAGRKS